MISPDSKLGYVLNGILKVARDLLAIEAHKHIIVHFERLSGEICRADDREFPVDDHDLSMHEPWDFDRIAKGKIFRTTWIVEEGNLYPSL